MEWMALCTSPVQKSSFSGGVGFLMTLPTSSSRSDIPSFFEAEMGTTGSPRCSLSFCTSMELPEARTSSIMFRAMTMGMRSSISCSVR